MARPSMQGCTRGNSRTCRRGENATDGSELLFGDWTRCLARQRRERWGSHAQVPAEGRKIRFSRSAALLHSDSNGRIADFPPKPLERSAVLFVVDPDQVLHHRLRCACTCIQYCYYIQGRSTDLGSLFSQERCARSGKLSAVRRESRTSSGFRP